MKLLYISNGNIPSRWAHTIQTMKMAEALAHRVPSFAPNSKNHRTALRTCPLKLREYLVARRPAIVSAIPSLRSVVVDGEDALVVPPDDPKALAEAIRRLEEDPALAQRIAARGFETVQPFSWDVRARDVLRSFAPDLLATIRPS